MTGKELGVIGRLRSHRAAVVGIAILLVAALACVGFTLASQGQEGRDGGEEALEEEYVLDISVEADGWDAETSSKVIVHVEGDDVGFYHAFDANDADATIAVPKAGKYTVTFISPVNADGSIYRVPDAASSAASVKNDKASASSSKTAPTYKFTKVEAVDVTADELNSIVSQVSDAVKKGDETLTGESGVAVVEKVKENAVANQNADQAAIEDTASAAEADAASGTSQATGTVSTSTSGSSSSSSNNSSSPAGSNSGSSSSNSSSSAGGSSGSTASAECNHNWVAQTTTVHHDAVTHEETVYTTVHHDAEYAYKVICNGCGTQFNTTSEWGTHSESQLLSNINTNCGSYYTKKVVTQQAYDEKVATDTKTVVDQAAYDETVITGYKCSTCGATK